MICDVGEVSEGATEGLANEVVLIPQPFRRRFTYITGTSLTSPGEPPMDNRMMMRRSVACHYVAPSPSFPVEKETNCQVTTLPISGLLVSCIIDRARCIGYSY